jgi:carbon storage regulator CsrA
MPSLTISRTERQRVFVGDNIIIEVVEARAGRARLRITAPKDVVILREELRGIVMKTKAICPQCGGNGSKEHWREVVMPDESHTYRVACPECIGLGYTLIGEDDKEEEVEG